jgi:membrane protein implicated in regulation of membrane protease activity
VKAPSKKEWFEACLFIFLLFVAVSIAYALRGWAISEHLAVSLGVIVIFGLAAAAIGVRMVARSKSKGEDQDLKQRELRALAEEQLERARRDER